MSKQETLLCFASRTGLLTEKIASQLAFDGDSAASTLASLCKAKLIKSFPKTIAAKYSYYQITQQGFKRINCESGAQPKELSQPRLDQRLQLSWSCANGEQLRFPLLPSEVRSRYRTALNTKNHRFVLTEEFGVPVVLRCYFSNGSVTAARDHVRSFWKELRNQHVVGADIRSGRLGVSVIAQTPEKAADISSVLADQSQVRLLIGCAPTSDNYSDFVRQKTVGGCTDGSAVKGDGNCS